MMRICLMNKPWMMIPPWPVAACGISSSSGMQKLSDKNSVHAM